jgi:hypothetical protein
MYFASFCVNVYVIYLQIKSVFYDYGCSIIHRLFSIKNPLHIYKVVKYNPETDEEIDMTTEYSQGVVFHMKEPEYLEFRVIWLDKQYRYIVNGTHPEFPSYSDFATKQNTHIMFAVLVNTREFVYTDVIDRVQKFIGHSSKPFFGKSIRCRQLFMNDDLTDDHELHVVTKDGRILQFSTQDVIGLNK